MNPLTHLAQTDAYDYTPVAGEDVIVDPSTGEAAANAGLVLLPILLIIGLISYVLYSWMLGKIFKKAGVEAWKAWVPFYNIWIMYKLGNTAGWWTILLFVPIINIVASVFFYIASYRIGQKLGKTGAFVLWAIFFPIVWFAWLAFDDSVWHEDNATPVMSPEAPVAAQSGEQA
jgi:hypothetical protein